MRRAHAGYGPKRGARSGQRADRAARLAAEREWLAAYRADLLDRLAQLCGRPTDELVSESREIQTRVRAISANVNEVQAQRRAELDRSTDSLGGGPAAPSLLALVPAWLFASADQRPAPHVVVAEELDYHIVVRDVPLEVVAEIESRPEHYPGVRIVEESCRRYPQGVLAAAVLGHLGMPDSNDAETASDAEQHEPSNHLVGRLGAERQFEAQLRSRDGLLVDLMDHSGRLLKSDRRIEPATGADVVLTLHAELERIVEERLDRALAQLARAVGGARPASGGAIVILEAHTGAILAAATAPRHDPNIFAAHDAAAIEQTLADQAHPLFDRATKMAIPPGSVFKTVTAFALLADHQFNPQAAFDCQGYLAQPDRQRCQTFRRYGMGHGATNLSDALAQSCNVYFFHHAEQLGVARLTDWGAARVRALHGSRSARRSRRVSAKPCQSGRAERNWELADTQALAIGQSTLTATPLQVARLLAAIANGGYLVTPHVAAGLRSATVSNTSDEATIEPFTAPPRQPIAGLTRRELGIIRAALARVVDDPQGTAYATLSDVGIPVAGKTGTAETGERSADHAWFAGYAPADAPRVAFAIALEHQGSADHAAALAKEIVQAMDALGVLRDRGSARTAYWADVYAASDAQSKRAE